MKVTLKHSSARCMTAEKGDSVKTAGGVMAPQSCRDGKGVGTCPLDPLRVDVLSVWAAVKL